MTMLDLHPDLHRSLPIAWDGRPLAWGPWETSPPTFICDRTRRRGLTTPTCETCGSTRPPLVATALRSPLAGDVEPGEYLRRHRNGRRVYAQEPMPAYRDLVAFRCQDCGHDAVYDRRTGESWELDESDYGPDGSTAGDEGCR